jgi:hypothetical protein
LRFTLQHSNPVAGKRKSLQPHDPSAQKNSLPGRASSTGRPVAKLAFANLMFVLYRIDAGFAYGNKNRS